MTLTFKGLNKKGNVAFYAGARTVLRFSLASFVNKTAPSTIEIEGDFVPETSKVKLTPEERKAARAAAPKPTLAEKIAAREASLAKLKAQAAALDT